MTFVSCPSNLDTSHGERMLNFRRMVLHITIVKKKNGELTHDRTRARAGYYVENILEIISNCRSRDGDSLDFLSFLLYPRGEKVQSTKHRINLVNKL